MIELKEYKVLSQLYSGKSLVLRAKENRTNKKVIIKIPSKSHLSSTENKLIEYEFRLYNRTYRDNISLKKFDGIPAIVEDDNEGIALSSILNKSESLVEKIEIMLSLIKNLEHIHSLNILHNNINTDNIIFNPNSKMIRIIDFGISTEFNKVATSDYTMDNVPLKCISPERTGWTNYKIDKRSDYYSLGVTFYEILASQVPFPYNDSIELIHAHIAKMPTKIKKIPIIINDIIFKLLQKDPNDRYQSITGLYYDLEKCYKDLLKDNKVSFFELGEKDYSTQLKIPEKLYGNYEIKEKLNKIIENYNEGNKSITLITGESGFGKSTLIKELYTPISKNGGLMLTGKYENTESPVNCKAIISALEKIILSLYKESDKKKEIWKKRIINELGDNTFIISKAIPSLKQLLGDHDEIPKIDIQLHENRFYYTICKFISIFTSDNKPLVIALENVELIDNSSIQLIKTVLNDNSIKNVNFICVGSTKKDKNKIDSLREICNEKDLSFSFNSMELQPLSEDDISLLLSDILSTDVQKVSQFASLLYSKTKGHPYFINQQLISLYEKKSVYFDLKRKEWKWDIDKINELQITNNVVELLKDNINRLSSNARDLLKLISVIGFNASYKDINSLYKEIDLLDLIGELIEMDYIKPTNNSFKIVKDIDQEINTSFQFTHYKIWETVYSITDTAKLHLKFGKILKKDYESNPNKDSLFQTVSHLNIVIDDITDKKELDTIFLLNLEAAKIAKTLLTFDSAKNYLNIALITRKSEHWKSQYKEMLFLYNNLAEVSLLLGAYDEMDKYFKVIEENISSVLDRILLCKLKIKSEIARNRPLKAIEVGKSFLKELDFKIPKKINTSTLLYRIILSSFFISKKSKDALRSVNDLTDTKKLAIMEILFNIQMPCYLSNPTLSLYVSIIQVEYSIKFGNSPFAINAYNIYGVILTGILHDYKNGIKYDDFSKELAKKYDGYEFYNRLLFQSSDFVLPLYKPLQEVCSVVQEAYKNAIKYGDMQYAAWGYFLFAEYSFYAGENLNIVKKKLNKVISKSTVFKQETQILYSEMFLELVTLLQNEQNIPQKRDERLKILEKHNDLIGIYLHYFTGALSACATNNLEEANKLIDKALAFRPYNIAAMALPLYLYYAALIKAQLYLKTKNKKLLKKAKEYVRSFKKYSKQNEHNFKHKYLIIKATILSLTSPKSSVHELYEEAIILSEKNGFLNDGALACELAGNSYIRRNRNFIGKTYIDKANKMYQSWGAYQRSKLLQQKYPSYILYSELAEIENPVQSFKDSTIKHFDTSALIKASKLISKEINLETYLNNMMKIVLENSGASKGVLLLKQKNNYYIEAVADMPNSSALQHELLHKTNLVPHSIINSVNSIGNTLVIDHVGKEKDFNQDAYFINNPVKSIFVLPLYYKNEMVGTIYLENSLSEAVFRIENRVELLTMLASDIVISLENARLYYNLEQSNKKLEEAADKAKKSALISKELAEKAQVADKVKGQFLSNLSHEFRTPMNAIIGMINLMDETTLNQTQEEYLGTLKKTSYHLMGILNGILDFSEINSGSMSLNNTSCNLFHLLNEISEKAFQFIGEKNIKITKIVSEDIPEKIIADYNRLKQAMLNLIDNAIKFTKEGNVIIEISLISEPEEGKYEIKFLVKDTGIGISENRLNELSKAFTQEDASTTRSYGGLGLGLAITNEIAKLMNGTLGVKKNDEEGSSVWFTFIANRDDSIRIAPEVKKDEDKKDIVILIVEDNPINQKLAKTFIDRYGYKNEIAENGKIAIKKLSESNFDMVLMDCQMPIMDGYQATELIRNHESSVLNHTIPIIAVTGNAMPGDKEKCLGIGMDDYLAKPFTFKELKDIINKWQ